MTIYMKDFGQFLVTRQDAKSVLKAIPMNELPILDFSGVRVANHPFMDELGKGIASQLHGLGSVRIENSTPYIDNCVAAGFATASAAA